jgi:FixJ family two-component response regulator
MADYTASSLVEREREMMAFVVRGHTNKQIAARIGSSAAKPFRGHEMLEAVYKGLACDRKRRDLEQSISDLRARFHTLTPREREILDWVASGLMNEQIAAKMGIAQMTVKTHREQIRRKLGAKSLADLARIADRLRCAV